MSRAEKIALVVTPLAAMATLALGLHVGARSAVRAAIVYGAPRAHGASAFAWQLVSVLEDRAVRESVQTTGIVVRARSRAQGQEREASWRGDTNGDGVAEIVLDMPWVKTGDAVDLEITAASEKAPLARGEIAWGEEPWMSAGAPSFVRPSRRQGDVQLDLAIVGGALVPGFATSTWVRAIDPATNRAIEGVTIAAEPEPGLSVVPTSASTCDRGWAEFLLTPAIHVIGLSLHARAPNGRTGDWAGAPPVAPGASQVALPVAIDAGAPREVEIVAPTARQVAYIEVDDEAGRAFAAALALTVDRDGMPRARVELPPMAEGLHWLVTSGEPRGAESMRGAAIARPFWVEGRGAPPPSVAPPAHKSSDPCDLGPFLATHSASGFHKWIALDGFVGRRDANAANRRLGLLIALGSLAVGALLELLLMLRGAARTRADLARAASALDDAGAGASLTRRTSAGSVAIGILVALLGFGLLAAMLLWRAG